MLPRGSCSGVPLSPSLTGSPLSAGLPCTHGVPSWAVLAPHRPTGARRSPGEPALEQEGPGSHQAVRKRSRRRLKPWPTVCRGSVSDCTLLGVNISSSLPFWPLVVPGPGSPEAPNANPVFPVPVSHPSPHRALPSTQVPLRGGVGAGSRHGELPWSPGAGAPLLAPVMGRR